MNHIFAPRLCTGIAVLCGLLSTFHATGQPSFVRLNEVLANNTSLTNVGGVPTDWIELFNTSSDAVDLGDTSLSDLETNMRRFVFPAGTTIPAGGFLVMRCNPLLPASATNAGLDLKAAGGTLYFSDKSTNGGGLIDSIEFGIQAANYSIGRDLDGDGGWQLCVPSPASSNQIAVLGTSDALRVNEWMADRPGGASAWFEIFNGGTRPVSLGGLGLADNLTGRRRSIIPNLSFIGVGSRGAYAVFIADNNPFAGANHVSFGLNEDLGEAIGIYDGGRVLIDGITFGPQKKNISEGRYPDGSNNIVTFRESPSPGSPNIVLVELADVVFNEILAHTDPPLEDAVELYNATDAPIDISGWYLSNDLLDLARYRIADGTMLPAHGFSVFYESQFNATGRSNPTTPFNFSSVNGGELILSRPDTTGAAVAYTRQLYGASQNGVSMGRHPTSEGVDFVPMSAHSFGQARPRSITQFRRGQGATNPLPLVGPIVINEVMYHPPDSGTNDNLLDEFIELRNTSSRRVPLFDPSFPTNCWRLRDAVEFTFPEKTWLAPDGHLLVVPFDPSTEEEQLALFRARYRIDPSVPIFGPYEGALSDDGESVELWKPDRVQLPPHPDAGFVPWLFVERVRYRDYYPWPVEADGASYSLQRRRRFQYGNDALNWKAAEPTAGRRNATPPVITRQPASRIYVAGSDTTYAVTATGSLPLAYQWQLHGTNLPGATSRTLTLANLQPSNIGPYTVVVSNDEGDAISEPAMLRLDSKQPVLRITTPRPNARLSNTVTLVEGVVRDDFGVSNVLVSVNDGGFQTAAGRTNWTASILLVPGTNTIRAKAVDLGLNESPVVTLRVFHAVPSPLTLRVTGNGQGGFTPLSHGQMLEEGRGYSITAVPAPGSLFSNWIGSGIEAPFVRRGTTLHFLMEEDLTIEAAFVLNPFSARHGTYNGLCHETGEVRHASSGFFTATTTALGAYTASLQLGGRRYSITGKFDLGGRATNSISARGITPLTLELALDLNDEAGRITGHVLRDGWVAELLADRATFHPVSNPAPAAGRYTMFLPGAMDDPALPAGDSLGTATVSSAGLMTFNGVLGDGTKVTQKTGLSRNGDWPFYSSLYAGKGSILGWIAVRDFTNADLRGEVNWFKPTSPGSPYSAGFTHESEMIGSLYMPPGTNRVLNLERASLVFTAANPMTTFTNAVTLGSDNQLADQGTNHLTLKIALPTGTFTGSVVDPISDRTMPFKGVILQKQNGGAGFFNGTNGSGRVRLEP